MNPATQFNDVAAAEQVIVNVVCVGVEVAAIVRVAQEGVDAASAVIAAEVEDVEGVVAVAVVDPHLPGQRTAWRQRGVEIGHLGGVGVDHLGLPHQLGHKVDQRAGPSRRRGPSNRTWSSATARCRAGRESVPDGAAADDRRTCSLRSARAGLDQANLFR